MQIIGNDKNEVVNNVKVQSGMFNVADTFLEVSLGNIIGYSTLVIESSSSSIPSAVIEDVWSSSGQLVYLTAAETMDIVSDSANDADLGTGARTLKITGLDSSYNEITEDVILNGLTPVVTSNSYLRVRQMEVLTAGSLSQNEGTILATASTAVTIQCAIPPTASFSKNSQYTVPAGKNLVVLGAEFNATRLVSGMAPDIQISALIKKPVTDAPWIKAVERRMDTSVLDQLIISQPIGNIIDPQSDFKFTVESDEADSECRVRLYCVLIDV